MSPSPLSPATIICDQYLLFHAEANYTHHSSTHWYRRYYRYGSLCANRQGLVEWWAGLAVLGLFDMVNTSSTEYACCQQLTRRHQVHIHPVCDNVYGRDGKSGYTSIRGRHIVY